MRFQYDVTAKVETLHLSRETRWMLHGNLSVEGSPGDPLALAIAVPDEIWDTVKPGVRLFFDYNPVLTEPVPVEAFQ